jgi:hypothetical protein
MAVLSLIFTTPDSRPRHSPQLPTYCAVSHRLWLWPWRCIPSPAKGLQCFVAGHGWPWRWSEGGRGRASSLLFRQPRDFTVSWLCMADHAWRCIPLPAKGLHCFVVMAGHGAASHWRDRKGGAASHISIAIINERAQLARRQSSLSAFLLPIFPEFDLVHDLVHARLGK